MKTPLPVALTGRQQQIAACLLAGMSIKKIANQLGLSVNTIREHQTSIRKKLLCQNAYQMGSKLIMLLNSDVKISHA